MKDELIKEFLENKNNSLDVIIHNGKKYNNSEFTYWLIDKMADVMDQTKKIKALLEWDEVAEKLLKRSKHE